MRSTDAEPPVQATAEGLPAAPDPMVDLCVRYRAAMALFEDGSRGLPSSEADTLADRTFAPLYDELRDRTPGITTKAGAVEAIRTALAECDMDGMSFAVLTAALAFLGGRA